MFTGLIEGQERILNLAPEGSGLRLRISSESFWCNSKIGDSISINGTCLTIVELSDSRAEFQISPESLARTHWKSASEGQWVNVERAVQAGGALGGHFVTGHVDGIGRVSTIEKVGLFWNFEMEFPKDLELYFVEKGSVCIDGVSLTVNVLRQSSLELTIIPETFEKTIFKRYKIGDLVNIEADLIGKYVVRFLEKRNENRRSP